MCILIKLGLSCIKQNSDEIIEVLWAPKTYRSASNLGISSRGIRLENLDCRSNRKSKSSTVYRPFCMGSPPLFFGRTKVVTVTLGFLPTSVGRDGFSFLTGLAGLAASSSFRASSFSFRIPRIRAIRTSISLRPRTFRYLVLVSPSADNRPSRSMRPTLAGEHPTSAATVSWVMFFFSRAVRNRSDNTVFIAFFSVYCVFVQFFAIVKRQPRCHYTH